MGLGYNSIVINVILLKFYEVDEIFEGKDEKYKVIIEIFDIIVWNLSVKLKWGS